MLKLVLFLVISNMIYCEQRFILSVKEKMMENLNDGDLLPLIVKPSEVVPDPIDITCNGKIRYNPPDYTTGYDLQDTDPKTTIQANTPAGTEISFNCKVSLFDPNTIKNKKITIILDDSMTNWSIDPQKNTIQFLTKYSAKPESSNSKNLAQDGIFKIIITLMSSASADISIEDGTFILKNGDTSVNLKECGNIPKDTPKGTFTISCKVEGEVKENKYTLTLGDGKKIDGIEPLVSGETSFTNKVEQTKPSSSTNNCKNLCFVWELMIISLVLLF